MEQSADIHEEAVKENEQTLANLSYLDHVRSSCAYAYAYVVDVLICLCECLRFSLCLCLCASENQP